MRYLPPAGVPLIVLLLLASAFALGCARSYEVGEGGDGGTVVPPGRDGGPDTRRDSGLFGPGMRELYVVSAMDVARQDLTADPMIVPGFDVDGRVSDGDDVHTCFQHDFISPPPDNEQGVDSALGITFITISEFYDLTDELARAIASGSLLLLVEVSDLHDRTNDAAVTVELFEARAPGGVTLDASGRLAPEQGFEEVAPRGRGSGAVVNGRLTATLGTVRFPFVITAPASDLDLSDAQIRFNLAGGAGLDTGVLGGAMTVQEVGDALMASIPDLPEILLWSPLEGYADLARDDVTARCRSISAGYVFEAVPARWAGR